MDLTNEYKARAFKLNHEKKPVEVMNVLDKKKDLRKKKEFISKFKDKYPHTREINTFDEGICVKMEPYKCMREYNICHTYYLGICIKSDRKTMLSTCTRTRKFCCDGYRRINETGHMPEGDIIDDWDLDLLIKDDADRRNLIAGNFEEQYPEEFYDAELRQEIIDDITPEFVELEDHDTELKCGRVSMCGGLYKLTEYDEDNPKLSMFSTYGYPSTYPEDLVCDWHIQAPEGYHIELELGVIVIEKSEGCSYDKVKTWDEINERIICGYGNPGLITSVGNNLWVKFTSDMSEGYRGFKGKYKFVKDEVQECEAPFVWNHCPYECQLTCEDMDPLNPNRRICYHRDKPNFIAGKSKVKCEPGCACPMHAPILHIDEETGEKRCIPADLCPGIQTCGIAPLQNREALARSTEKYMEKDDEDWKDRLFKTLEQGGLRGRCAYCSVLDGNTSRGFDLLSKNFINLTSSSRHSSP